MSNERVGGKAVAYVRVSTHQQDEYNQIRAIEKFSRERGIELLKGVVFIDKGESRRKKWSERPGARRLVEWLEDKGGRNIVDYVIVFDLTRLGASMLDVLNLFKKLEEDIGVKVLSVNDAWLQSTDENLRRLLIAIFTWMADMELKLRKERQEAAWESGKQKGRPQIVSDEELVNIWKTYNGKGYSKKAIWAIAKDRYERRGRRFISYERFVERLKKLCREKTIKC